MGACTETVSAQAHRCGPGQSSEGIRRGAQRANHAYPAVMTALAFLDSAAPAPQCGVAAAPGAARDHLNALNVFPVADSDTGTNLHLTMLSAVRGLDEVPAAPAPNEVWQALSRGVLLGAQGNSGVIVSQFLRGLAEVCAPASPCDRRQTDPAYVSACIRTSLSSLGAGARPGGCAGSGRTCSGGTCRTIGSEIETVSGSP